MRSDESTLTMRTLTSPLPVAFSTAPSRSRNQSE